MILRDPLASWFGGTCAHCDINHRGGQAEDNADLSFGRPLNRHSSCLPPPRPSTMHLGQSLCFMASSGWPRDRGVLYQGGQERLATKRPRHRRTNPRPAAPFARPHHQRQWERQLHTARSAAALRIPTNRRLIGANLAHDSGFGYNPPGGQ
jgi:hypothetical protein